MDQLSMIPAATAAEAPTTYANAGACRKGARRALGADTQRGVHFEMAVGEDGRWTWWKLDATPEVVTDETGEAKVETTLTREQWLRECVHRLHSEVFVQTAHPAVGETVPQFRISCSFPGGGAARKRIGECWSHKSSADGTTEMMVSPLLDDPMMVAATVAHEMVHMYVGVEAGHKGPFKALATAVGLEGKMTATVAGEAFKAIVQPILDDMGAYPHAKLSLAGRKVKKTYLLKAECTDCGCTFRITQKWLDAADTTTLVCPIPGCGQECTIE